MRYAGLVEERGGPCGDHFRTDTRGTRAVCTHGPDPAPAGVDVTQERTTADLLTGGPNGSPSTTGSVQCIGDGTSGPRVQAVYAVAADRPDRFDSVAPSIARWAGQVDGVFSQSAAETGGDRHVRFVTNPDCSLNIQEVVLSATGDDNYAGEIDEVMAQGLTRPLTKYLIWTDATVYCGISQVIDDDTPGPANSSNTTTEYSRIDSGCWGRTDHLSEAHELMHALGGVQSSAPHGTPNLHCSDEYDVMCYSDSPGVVLTYPCPVGHEWLFDCDADDYYDTSPSPGSYLDTHWNIARSQFLFDPSAPAPPVTTTTLPPLPTTVPSTTTTVTSSTTTTTTTTMPPPTTPTVPATTTTTSTAPPTTVPPTVTTTFTGSVGGKRSSPRLPLQIGAGAMTDALQFSVGGKQKVPPALTLTVYRADGSVALGSSGPSVLRQAATLPAGSYTWVVSGTVSASFTLTITHAP